MPSFSFASIMSWATATSETPIDAVLPKTTATTPAPTTSTSESTPTSTNEISNLTNNLQQTGISDQKDPTEAAEEETPAEAPELHPNDDRAEVTHKAPENETGAANTTPTIYQSIQTFQELGLSKALLDGLTEMKFTAPSKIQASALPIIFQPNHPNLIGQAHHGSGKTATFSLGILNQIDFNKQTPQAIVACPTRELARQIAQVILRIGKYTPVTVCEAIQGSARDRITSHVIVGTPGTVLAKARAREFDIRQIRIFVADEADQMVDKGDMGEQTVKITKQLNKNAQILLFSATFNDEVTKLARAVAPNAHQILVKTEAISLDNIKQFFFACKDEAEKYRVLNDIYGLLGIGQSIIFVDMVRSAKALANRMRQDGYEVSLLHGQDMPPEERDRVMADFRDGKTTVLIATNVIARGIDVPAVTLVVNFEIPLNKYHKPDYETYVHRIGRAGRFGRLGVALNFISDPKSVAHLQAISEYYNKEIIGLPTNNLTKVTEIIHNSLKKPLPAKS